MNVRGSVGATRRRADRLILIAVGALSGLMIVLAWSNVDRLSPGWWYVALGVSTLAAAAGVAAVATGRIRIGGIALVCAALTAPTGLAFLVNVVVVVLAVPLIVLSSGENAVERTHDSSV